MEGAENRERSERVGWDSNIAKFEDDVTETKRTSSGEREREMLRRAAWASDPHPPMTL
jgi:hypothetical protein